jgi:hypothetical protein
MTNCDYCELEFANLFNVDYLDGYANVLCVTCVDVSKQFNSERIESVWQ